MEEKLEFIKNIFKTHELIEIPEHIKDSKNIDIIYNIFNDKDEKVDTTDGIYEHYMGLYYDIKEGNIENSKQWYLKAIEKGNSYSMSNYAMLMKKENNIEEAKKYFLMAIKKGNIISMNSYAGIMSSEGKVEWSDLKYSEAEKYYLMAIENCNDLAMYNYAMFLKTQRVSEASLLKDKSDKDIYVVKKSIKYFYKYYKKTQDQDALDRIDELLENMSEFVGQLVLDNEELTEKVDELQNFKKAVNDMGPMNALVLGYI